MWDNLIEHKSNIYYEIGVDGLINTKHNVDCYTAYVIPQSPRHSILALVVTRKRFSGSVLWTRGVSARRWVNAGLTSAT